MNARANLSWAKLTACSLDAAKFWLQFIAGVWMNATHGSEEVEEVYQKTLLTIEGMEGNTYSDDPSDDEVQRVYDAFEALATALTGLDHNPVNVTCKLDNEHGKKLRLGWDGAWTGGRYITVSYEPRNYPTLFAEWDTGTGEESTFLALPSTAEKFVEENSKAKYPAKVCPVVNHYRIACGKLGIDIADIPERGYEGVRKAQHALEDLIESTVRAAKQEARDSGAATA